jgi:hypothetical protein
VFNRRCQPHQFKLFLFQPWLDEFADGVEEEFVGFLNAGGDSAGDMDFDVSGTFGEASAFSKKNNASHADPLRFFYGGEHIARLTARGEPNEDIPRFAEGSDLAGEDVLEGVVVADGGEESAV